ncbi:MAG: helix-turn-helix domain-containing protein [Myroides sp.]|jgi:excisionase family DNA binding protein|nr:helix-turn-helix domain-containing protein [Myroides sp.]
MEKFYTVEEVAHKLKLHPRTIRRRIAQDEIQAIRVGKQYRIYAEQIDRLNIEKSSTQTQIPIPTVSSIVEIELLSTQQYQELSTKITALFMTKSFEGNIHCSFNKQTDKLKIFIDATLENTPTLLSILHNYIQLITEQPEK